MKLTKKLEAEILKAYHELWEANINGDIKTFAAYLDNDIIIYGTAGSEVFTSKKEAVRFYDATADQMTGKADFRKRRITTRAIGDAIVINEQCDLYVPSGEEWIFYDHVRVTAIFVQKGNAWKIVHMHGSFPDSRTEAGNQIAVEKIAAENQQLREAVKRRTVELEEKHRELEIESALEKVRTVAMGMVSPQDMLRICKTISEQLEKLDVKNIRNVQTAIFYPERGTYMNYEYYARHDQSLATDVDYRNHEIQRAFAKKMMKGPGEALRENLKGKKLLDWYEFQKTTNQFADEHLLTAESLNYYWFSLGPVALGISTYAPLSQESIDLFKKFMKVFELAYQRYLDIEKALAQAKEAQIEAALERVRTQSMAMQNSEALKDVISLLLAEIRKLDIPAEHAGFYIDYKQRDDWHIWLADPKRIPYELTVPYFNCLVWQNYNKAKDQGLDAFAYTYSFEEKNDFYEKMFRLFPIPDEARSFYMQCPGLSVSTVLLDTVGLYVENFSGTPYTEEENRIVKRFGKVFQQTYTRFEDLQKAEAQAREAQIEAALERVRAASLAMRDSTALSEIIYKLYGELTKLDAKLDRCFIMIVHPENNGITWWMAGQEGLLAENGFFVQMNEHPSHLMYLDYCMKRKKKWTYLFEGKEKRDWDRFGFSKTALAKLPEPVKNFMAAAKEVHLSGSSDQFGSLVTGSFEPLPDEQQEIISRFSIAFNQAYIRFLDLQKAEAQAKEAKIEAALERVRSRSLAMHHSSELSAVVDTLLREFTNLEFTLTFCIINLINEEDRSNTVWAANPETGKPPESYYMKFEDYPFHHAMWAAWKAQKKNFIYTIEGEEKEIYDEYLYTKTEFRRFPKHVQDANKSLKRYVAGFTFFKHSGLQTVSENHISDEDLAILERFGRVFEQSYTRFLDLQKAEAQAREAQIQLALERVRARSMAMQRSDELAEVSYLLNKQVVELGIPTRGCAFNIYNEHDSTEWFSNLEGTLPAYKTPRENVFLKYYEAGQQGETLMIEAFGKERIRQHYEYLFSLGYFGNPEHKDEVLAKVMPESQVDHAAFFKYGYLLFITLEPAPEAHDIFKRFAKEFEQTYTRFLDLQKAETQAREAQIEAALERVRSKTMAMHNSQDVGESVATLFEELISLGVLRPDERCGIGIMLPDHQMEAWTAAKTADGKAELTIGYLDMTLHPLLQSAYQGWVEKKEVNQYLLEGDDKIRYHEAMLSQPNYKIKRDYYSGPIRINHSDFYFKEGCLYVFSQRDLPLESLRIYTRFAAVFGQTYRRYQDLLKAEAQAREAQIEAALESVRSRAMAMRTSEDIAETTAASFAELKKLGISSFRSGVGILTKGSRMAQVFADTRAEDGQTKALTTMRSMDEHPALQQQYIAWEKQEDYEQFLSGEELITYYSHPFFQKSNVDLQKKEVHSQECGYYFAFPDGLFYSWSNQPYTESEKSILRRFRNIISLTFRRYLDLQKAEAQAREAQIEVALEKVRSRTMAMQKPEELADTAHVLFEQLKDLGVTHERINIGIVQEPEETIDFWLTEQGGNLLNNRFIARISEPTTLFKVYQAWKAGSKSLVVDLQGKELEQWIEFLHTEVHIPFEAPVKPVRRVHTAAMFSKGMLILSSPEPLPQEALYLLERFAGVFDLTYTRFNDLKTAEAQAREATKQASLDRVRAVIASMRSTEDLDMITPLIFRELTTLDVPFIRCGVFIIHEARQIINAYLSSPTGESLGVLHLPFQASELTMQTVEAWRHGQVHRQHWNQEDFIAWTKQMMEQHQIESSRTYQGADAAPESLDLHFVPFSQGMLYVGSLKPLGENDLELVQSLAKAFSIAYARYEDFVQLETAKASIESTLTELKSTQAQLIQQEKLASLGQLTAGIAHEIQNPLNFVNNFSEINAELSEEILEAVAKGDIEEVKALATDIKSNQEKIREHGKRADSIVKGMLEHSRSSAGAKEATDISALADEYLRLAYHGMRAKDKSFNASLKTDFDPQLPLVPVVSQDISRVLLNLFNNAFYAVNERNKTGGDGYEPEVRLVIRTDHKGAVPCITIAVSDNGSGIPEAIKEKIFQPFFTTKPTGQGTGLGLSLSYDIVKAHGGEIKVNTKENEGTEFTISLPLQA